MSPALLRALCGWLSPSVDRISLGRFAKCVRCWHRLRASEFGSAWRQDPLLHVGRHFSGSHNPQQLPSGVRDVVLSGLHDAYAAERLDEWIVRLSKRTQAKALKGLQAVQQEAPWPSVMVGAILVPLEGTRTASLLLCCVATCRHGVNLSLEGCRISCKTVAGSATQAAGTAGVFERLPLKGLKAAHLAVCDLEGRVEDWQQDESSHSETAIVVSIYDRKGRTISKGIELPLHPIPSHGTSPDTGSSNTLQKSSKQCGLPPPSQSYVELFREQAASISLVQIGHIRSKYKERHGTPRQAVLADDGGADLPDSELILDPAIPREALDSLHGFDYAWIISYLHLNRFGNPNATGGHWKAMVRPPPPLVPHSGGSDGESAWRKAKRRTRKVGVLATRAPHRPNPVGLSAVRITGVDYSRGVIKLRGVDLLDGTPILDIKPYVPYADAFPAAKAGWLDGEQDAKK